MAPEPAETEGPGAPISLLLARKWTVAGVAAIVMVAGLVLSYRETPIYASSASVLVSAPAGSTSQSQINMATEKDVAASTAVADIVVKALRLTTPADALRSLSVQVPVDTEILQFHYSDPNPATAQLRAQAFADAYLQYRLDALRSDVVAAQRPIEEKIRSLNDQLNTIQKRGGDSPVDRAQISSLLTQIAILEQKWADLTSPDALSPGTVIAPAQRPTAPARPKHAKDGIVAAILGLFLGVGVAMARDYFDDRIRGREDLEAQLGVPVLGAIPRVKGIRGHASKGLVSTMNPEPFAVEAFRRLGANLAHLADRSDVKTIMVCSARQGEGKSFTTANLGVALAGSGKRVTLVSADLRRPRLEQFFKQPRKTGLVDVLRQDVQLSATLLNNGIPNLKILPSGTPSPNPAELLSSGGLSALFAELAETADLVLLDTAPILAVTDTALLAESCDGVLFVADGRSATRATVKEARRQLESVQARLLGAVLIDPHVRPVGKYPYLVTDE